MANASVVIDVPTLAYKRFWIFTSDEEFGDSLNDGLGSKYPASEEHEIVTKSKI